MHGKDQQNVEHLLCMIEDEYTEIIQMTVQFALLFPMCPKRYVGGRFVESERLLHNK